MTTTGFIVDASVALKWFSLENEPDTDLALKLIGDASMQTTSLGFLEIGARMCRSRESTPQRATAVLEQMREICGEPVELKPEDYLVCAEMAEQHSITFYDASYAAIAARLGRTVISTDRDLLEPGLAVDIATALESI